MSLRTWKLRFYKSDAQQCPRWLALAHSTLKWIGLQTFNLNQHNLHTEYLDGIRSVYDEYGNQLVIGGSTCALCRNYYDNTKDAEGGCKRCPLVLHTGISCLDDEDGWSTWIANGDATVMLQRLKKALLDAERANLACWISEFCPVPPIDIPAKRAIAAGLRLWKGLRQDNLAKYHLHISGTDVVPMCSELIGEHVPLPIFRCLFVPSLCEHYFDPSGGNPRTAERCANCPIQVYGAAKCRTAACTPWGKFLRDRDPEPMIRMLEYVREMEKLECRTF